jgi:hypothetical protein
VIARLDESVVADLNLIRRVFLRRQAFWPSGQAAHPVNLPASSVLRERFSSEVLGQSVKDLVPYWNERYFHGTRPPPTLASEDAVLLFVARTAGAVGYVQQSLTSSMPDGVRTILCVGQGEEITGSFVEWAASARVERERSVIGARSGTIRSPRRELRASRYSQAPTIAASTISTALHANSRLKMLVLASPRRDVGLLRR